MLNFCLLCCLWPLNLSKQLFYCQPGPHPIPLFIPFNTWLDLLNGLSLGENGFKQHGKKSTGRLRNLSFILRWVCEQLCDLEQVTSALWDSVSCSQFPANEGRGLGGGGVPPTLHTREAETRSASASVDGKQPRSVLHIGCREGLPLK